MYLTGLCFNKLIICLCNHRITQVPTHRHQLLQTQPVPRHHQLYQVLLKVRYPIIFCLRSFQCQIDMLLINFTTRKLERGSLCVFKGSQLGAFCPLALVYCYLEFKLCYLKNLKLFSVRVKELFEPIVLRKKGYRFLLFLKAFSWETDLWVMLGDFTVKNAKLGREVCIWLKID